MIVAGFGRFYEQCRNKDIFDLDEGSSQELDENGEYLDLDLNGVPDYLEYCSLVDQNIGVLAQSTLLWTMF